MISVTKLVKVSIILQCLALLSGILSLALPFWVFAENDDGEHVVRISRRTNAGLWLQRNTFDLLDTNTSQSRWDDSWSRVHGSPLDAGELTEIKGTMISGLSFQLLSICSCFAVCCFPQKKYSHHYSHHYSKILLFTIGSTSLSAILLLIGPVMYSTNTVHDYKFHKKELGAGFWFAVASTIMSFLACAFSIGIFIHFYRQEKLKRKRGQSNNGMSPSEVTRY